MNTEYFNAICEELAKSLHCEFHFYDYTAEWGWFNGVFETDRFGGVAAIVKFYDNTWWNDETAYGSLSEALAPVPQQVREMQEARKDSLAEITMFNYD